jgi:hypothetical protein
MLEYVKIRLGEETAWSSCMYFYFSFLHVDFTFFLFSEGVGPTPPPIRSTAIHASRRGANAKIVLLN